MDNNSFLHPQERGQKIRRNEEEWSKNRKKRERYSSKGDPGLPDCGHSSKNLKCQSLTKRDVMHFHKMFYATQKKIVQDHLILKYCNVTAPKRSRQKKDNSSRKGMSVTYNVKKATLRPGVPDKVPVCQKTFMNILGLKKTRIQNVCRKHFQGKQITDNRGGDTRSKKNIAKREAINTFMCKIQVIEQHYCRGKSKRQYLSSNLNLNKLWRLYNSSCEDTDVRLKAKKSFFRNFVNIHFNIGFGAPAVDACSKCLQLKEQLKRANTEEEKLNLMTQKRIHSLRAKAFFQMLGESSEDTIVMSYDCQKNQVLPKVPDQKAYYSRQLYLYNFTVVQGTSKDKLTKDNVFSYCWYEYQFAKGSNKIPSAVFHALQTSVKGPNIKKVRLFADGCGGQNKNTTLIGMVSKWLLEKAPPNVLKVEIIFPVVGHSFMPPDRVFAYIEKDIKKKDTIILPDEYKDIIANYATVIELGSGCPVFDWKSAITEVQKIPGSWHFKFNPSKRFILSRNKNKTHILVRGETFYRSDTGKPRSVVRKNKSVHEIQPEIVALRNAVKPAKIKDVNDLLSSHFGEKWRDIPDLNIYIQILDRGCENVEEDEVCEHEDDCWDNDYRV